MNVNFTVSHTIINSRPIEKVCWSYKKLILSFLLKYPFWATLNSKKRSAHGCGELFRKLINLYFVTINQLLIVYKNKRLQRIFICIKNRLLGLLRFGIQPIIPHKCALHFFYKSTVYCKYLSLISKVLPTHTLIKISPNNMYYCSQYNMHEN